VAGLDFGWPFCFYNYGQKRLLLNSEYGGDGTTLAGARNSISRWPRFRPTERRWT
jgi:hypothetical protein